MGENLEKRRAPTLLNKRAQPIGSAAPPSSKAGGPNMAAIIFGEMISIRCMVHFQFNDFN